MIPTERGDHEGSRDAEGKRETGFISEAVHILPQDGREEGRDEGTSVDGEVEGREELSQLLLLTRDDELISSEGRHTRLDPSGTHGN